MKFRKFGLSEIFGKSFLQLLLIIWAIFQLYPLVWMFLSSFKEDHQILSRPFSIPTELHFENYSIIWNNPTGTSLIVFLKNSIIVVVCSLAILFLISILAAWAMAKFKFIGKNLLFVFIALVFAIPLHSYIVGLYFFMVRINLINTLFGLILVYVAILFPFTVMLLQAYFRGFPDELIEAARIDGCSEIRLIFGIVVPISKGALIAAGVVDFIAVWNEFFLALVILGKSELYTLTVGLFQFKGNYIVQWNYMFASLTFAVIFPILIYAIFSRQIVEGMTVGAVKE